MILVEVGEGMVSARKEYEQGLVSNLKWRRRRCMSV